MKKTAFLLFLTALVHTATGQMVYGIADIPGITNDNSIVRAFSQDLTLIYSYNSSTVTGSFILYNHLTGGAQYFETPQKLQVKDMEIRGDNLYFCGDDNSGMAYVGQFDILGCFAGTAPFFYCTIPWAFPQNVLMNTATKMTTMETNGRVYILALGDATHNYTSTTPYVASNLFSAELTNTTAGAWSFSVDYQKVYPFTYTDIDCSDNYVIITAVDANDYAHFLVSYQTPTFFYNTGYVYPYEFALGTQVEDRQLLVKSMNGDRFAISCVPLGGNWIELVEVPIPLPSTLTRHSTQPSSSTPYAPGVWRIHDLRHNSISDHPLVLGKMALPPYDVYDTWVAEFNWARNASAQNNIVGIPFTSLDGVDGTINYVVTNTTIHLSLGKGSTPASNTLCFPAKNVRTNLRPFNPDKDHRSDHFINTAGNSNQPIYPTVRLLSPSIICH